MEWSSVSISAAFTWTRQLFKIWSFRGSYYEEWCLLECYVVWFL
jgi:hypothetical protein